MRRPRIRIRTLMIAVAVVGLAIGSWGLAERRRAYFQYRVRQLDEIAMQDHPFGSFPKSSQPAEERAAWLKRINARQAWHTRMREKYERAARYPWMPVEPDPPEP